MSTDLELAARATRIRRLGSVGGCVGFTLVAAFAIAGPAEPPSLPLRTTMLLPLVIFLWAQTRLRTLRSQARESGLDIQSLRPLGARDRSAARWAIAAGMCLFSPILSLPFLTGTRPLDPETWGPWAQAIPPLAIAGGFLAWWGLDRLAEIRTTRNRTGA